MINEKIHFITSKGADIYFSYIYSCRINISSGEWTNKQLEQQMIRSTDKVDYREVPKINSVVFH